MRRRTTKIGAKCVFHLSSRGEILRKALTTEDDERSTCEGSEEDKGQIAGEMCRCGKY